MKPKDAPGIADVLITIASPLIVAVLTVAYLVGWWVMGVWGWVRGEET